MNKSNLLLTKDNVLKIGDLGVAKLLVGTEGKSFEGTKPYMSPEQYEFRKSVDNEPDYDPTFYPEPYSFNTDVWFVFSIDNHI